MRFLLILSAALTAWASTEPVGASSEPVGASTRPVKRQISKQEANRWTRDRTRLLKRHATYGELTDSQDLSRVMHLASEADDDDFGDHKGGCFNGICKFVKRVFRRREKKVKPNRYGEVPPASFDVTDGFVSSQTGLEQTPLDVGKGEVIDDSPTWSAHSSPQSSDSEPGTPDSDGKKEKKKTVRFRFPSKR
ncbi:hypothetical protein FOZ60_000553 [Perkinsus olseni]|uniref:Uncharacterized protein n=1 Tax=Perkinsus olseni TaxID=32597 RepID=A0A7J6P253_PEROL|nr:hypothetical protein FOZ60_000553 [Perkinsus olseni]